VTPHEPGCPLVNAYPLHAMADGSPCSWCAGFRVGCDEGAKLGNAQVALADAFTRGHKAGRADGAREATDLLDSALGAIANAGGGDWTTQTPEWQDAAARWRDAFHRSLPAHMPEPPR